MKNNAGSGAIYGLGVLGAAVYFLQHATGLVDVLLGLTKSVFWPAVVVFKVLELFKM